LSYLTAKQADRESRNDCFSCQVAEKKFVNYYFKIN